MKIGEILEALILIVTWLYESIRKNSEFMQNKNRKLEETISWERQRLLWNCDFSCY